MYADKFFAFHFQFFPLVFVALAFRAILKWAHQRNFLLLAWKKVNGVCSVFVLSYRVGIACTYIVICITQALFLSLYVLIVVEPLHISKNVHNEEEQEQLERIIIWNGTETWGIMALAWHASIFALHTTTWQLDACQSMIKEKIKRGLFDFLSSIFCFYEFFCFFAKSAGNCSCWMLSFWKLITQICAHENMKEK